MKFIFPDPPKIRKKPVYIPFNRWMYRNGKRYAEWIYTDEKGWQHFRVIKKA